MYRSMIWTCLLLIAIGCDRINEKDYLKDYEIPDQGDGHCVLLEEYTGMRCVNCPAAAKQAAFLSETFGNRLVVVAVHAGGFAVPNGIFFPDLRTEAGNEYYSHFGFDATPVGMVNRTGVLNPDQWGAAVSGELEKDKDVSLTASVDYNEMDRSYLAHLDVSVLSGAKDYRLMLWLTEDSLVTPQITPTGTDKNYIQRHVLRQALNGVWGESLSLLPEENNIQFVSKKFALPEGYNAGRCAIVFIVIKAGEDRVAGVVKAELIRDTGEM